MQRVQFFPHREMREVRERRYDALADHFRQHLRLDLIYEALKEGSNGEPG